MMGMSFLDENRLDQRLLQYAVPGTHTRYTPADCARYALSVGLGHDPLDAQQLAFVQVGQPLRVVPTMAIVLGSAGFWLADPALRVDIANVLHGEQRLRMLRALPDEAEVVGAGEVVRVVDQGPGRGALLFTRTRLTDAHSGEPYAEMESTTFIRGAGGFGGPAGPVNAAPTAPSRRADGWIPVATRPEQALWYRLNGDLNPIHADPALARRGGFDRPILHGLCTLGIACQSLVRARADGDPTRLRELNVRFLAPVFPGETLVTDWWSDGAFCCRVPTRGVTVLRGHSIWEE